MDTKIEDREIQDWFHNFITLFRKKCSELSEFERTGIHGVLDFSKPCQVEIFLLKYPEIQLIILSKMLERKDMEVTVHGPFEGNEFIEKVEKFLSDERWQKKIENYDEGDGFEIFGEPDDTLANLLAKQLYLMMDHAKYFMFHPYDNIHSMGISQIDKNIWTDIRVGNVFKIPYNEKVEQAIGEIKYNAKIQAEMIADAPRLIRENLKRQRPFKNLPLPMPKEGGHGYGVHLFPPVIIGKITKPTTHQILNGIRADTTIFNKSFDLVINGYVVIVNRDGYVFIETNRKEQALKILNLIMAVGTLSLTPMFAVREQDLSIASYGKNRTVVSKQWNSQTLRSQLHETSSMFDFSLNNDRFEMTKETL